MKKANRTKPVSLTFRVTEGDAEIIRRNAKSAGMDLTKYLTTCAVGKEIIHINGFDDCARALRRQGPPSTVRKDNAAPDCLLHWTTSCRRRRPSSKADNWLQVSTASPRSATHSSSAPNFSTASVTAKCIFISCSPSTRMKISHRRKHTPLLWSWRSSGRTTKSSLQHTPTRSTSIPTSLSTQSVLKTAGNCISKKTI